MNNDTIQIWLYDTTNENKLSGTMRVPKDAELAPGQTKVRPKDGLYGIPMFDEEKQEWFGLTYEEWLKTKPFHNQPQVPSPQQETIASLLKQNASLQKQVQTQATVNANIMKSLAELKSKVK